MKSVVIFFIGIISLLALSTLFISLDVFAINGARANNNTVTTINAAGCSPSCQKVTNPAGNPDYYVPNDTVCSDWNAFLNHLPSGGGGAVTVGACCSSHSYQQCNSGNVWWYDSCNSPESLVQTCSGTSCSAATLTTYTGCSGSACTTSTSGCTSGTQCSGASVYDYGSGCSGNSCSSGSFVQTCTSGVQCSGSHRIDYGAGCSGGSCTSGSDIQTCTSGVQCSGNDRVDYGAGCSGGSCTGGSTLNTCSSTGSFCSGNDIYGNTGCSSGSCLTTYWLTCPSSGTYYCSGSDSYQYTGCYDSGGNGNCGSTLDEACGGRGCNSGTGRCNAVTLHCTWTTYAYTVGSPYIFNQGGICPDSGSYSFGSDLSSAYCDDISDDGAYYSTAYEESPGRDCDISCACSYY